MTRANEFPEPPAPSRYGCRFDRRRLLSPPLTATATATTTATATATTATTTTASDRAGVNNLAYRLNVPSFRAVVDAKTQRPCLDRADACLALWFRAGQQAARKLFVPGNRTGADQQGHCHHRDQQRSSRRHCGSSTHVTTPASVIGGALSGM